ncbi:hypothetical protein FQA39_LY03848 [Lamprigera yunnana]|nr:hypothetical protein FQA39_LY03848 [Lamprigera yunnana]
MGNEEKNVKEAGEHHLQLQLCKTRPVYRQGRNLTAVKVYTVNSESQHIFIYGVPKINLRNEIKAACVKYGRIKSIQAVTDYELEMFTECFHIQYERIQSARIAKRLLDNKPFFGGVLHVCYAPEHEQLEETREKLQQRSREVLSRQALKTPALSETKIDAGVELDEYIGITKSQIKKKRKYGDAFQKN